MPVVSVGRDRLFKALGKDYSEATAARKTPHHDVHEVEPSDLLPTLLIFWLQLRMTFSSYALTMALSWMM